MKTKKGMIAILIVALSLATAWAIRGQFGHEQGAAWAGAIGGLALVIVSGRADWYNKMLLIALASAVGWGAGGMISYGQVVGYGRSDNFINVFYGLGMLFVIGALFGLLGGGLVGLVLDATKTKKVKWGALVSEMTAGGLITYFFLVEQIGIKMTPPRSEAWAIVLGAGLAMLWHMAREQRNSAIRVSIYAALGGGFGFSFGNFLQVLGNVMEIPFNMWNVMEYSIGFFGGGGMAFGVFSSKWPQQENQPKNWANRLALLLIVVFIPLIVYRESLAYGHLLSRLGQIPNLEMISFYSTILAAVILILLATGLFLRLMKGSYSRKEIALLLFSYLAVYIVMSYIVTGMLAGKMILNHHLYVLNTMVIYILYKKNRFEAFHHVTDSIASKKWVALFFAILFCIAIFSLVAISIHGELPGSHYRF